MATISGLVGTHDEHGRVRTIYRMGCRAWVCLLRAGIRNRVIHSRFVNVRKWNGSMRMRGVVGPRVRTGRFASHIDFRSARGLSEAEEGHGPEDARRGVHG